MWKPALLFASVLACVSACTGGVTQSAVPRGIEDRGASSGTPDRLDDARRDAPAAELLVAHRSGNDRACRRPRRNRQLPDCRSRAVRRSDRRNPFRSAVRARARMRTARLHPSSTASISSTFRTRARSAAVREVWAPASIPTDSFRSSIRRPERHRRRAGCAPGRSHWRRAPCSLTGSTSALARTHHPVTTPRRTCCTATKGPQHFRFRCTSGTSPCRRRRRSILPSTSTRTPASIPTRSRQIRNCSPSEFSLAPSYRRTNGGCSRSG